MLLNEAIDQYLADRMAKGNAKGTVRNDSIALRWLLTDVGNIHVDRINARHMDTFWARHADWAPSTWNQRRTVLTTFFVWCQVRGYLPRSQNPMEGTRARKKPEKDRLIIPPDEWPALLDAAEDARDRAIIAIGLYLFTRISETVLLKWQDVDFKNHTISVWRSKTQTIDVLPMCAELEGELKRWHWEYGQLQGQVAKPGWFVTPGYSPCVRVGVPGKKGVLVALNEPVLVPGKSMTPENARVRVQATFRLAGYELQPGEGTHTLRRSGATALYQELSGRGHDRAIRMCQAMLGHASIQTTEVYLALNLDRKARNDLLAGKKMFTGAKEGQVVSLERAKEN